MNFTCFLVKIVGVIAIFEREYQNVVKVARKTRRILAINSSVFRKVKELFGEIKYAFAER